MASGHTTRRFRLLLDQGFPKPPGFDAEAVDKMIEVVHLSDWAPDLSEASTPDWVVYCEAAMGGMDAVVTRDFSQTGLAEEMVILSTLTRLHLVTFRHGIDDPISEWGQLLAYLPKIRAVMATPGSRRVILLPKPTLQAGNNLRDPREYLVELEQSTQRSAKQIRDDVRRTVADYDTLQANGGRYEKLITVKKRARSKHAPPTRTQ